MALIEWTDSFLMGVPEIDRQHEHLVVLINRLDEAVRCSKKSPVILQILTELAGYTKSHFEDEEKVMSECGYAGFEEHRDVHQKLLRDMTRILEKVKSNKMKVSVDLVLFLQVWLEKHLVGYDQQYARHIAALKTAGTAG